MRLAGALLSCLVAVSFAAAQPLKQDAAKALPAKKEPKASGSKPAKVEQKATLDAIAASYTAIPLTERITIRNDLVWTGDYNGLINGDSGDRAVAPGKASQKRIGAKEPGGLNPPNPAALAAPAKPKQET